MTDLLGQIDAMDRVLAGAVLIALLVALVTRRRGGRFRRLLGWVGFWVFFAVTLLSLTKLPSWFSLTLLGLLMFAGLRTYFFVAQMRPQDRFAILGAYLAVPVALWSAYTGAPGFLATVPIMLFLIFPALLTTGPSQEGMLDSLGRLLLGVVLFVFCAAHLGLLAGNEQLELFGVFALAAELMQRLADKPGPGAGWKRPLTGIAAGALLVTLLGFWIGPWAGVGQGDAALAGLLVVAGVTLGTLVTSSMLRDLSLSTQARHGRGVFLERVAPPIYAAPFFFHYLNYFA
jgi:predicted CDP-diglyceride synthetase/phosphatidate cytidylyltransferase